MPDASHMRARSGVPRRSSRCSAHALNSLTWPSNPLLEPAVPGPGDHRRCVPRPCGAGFPSGRRGTGDIQATRTGNPDRQQRPPPTGCRAMPAQAQGLLERRSVLGSAAVPDCQYCYRPKGSLAHTHHSSPRAASPQVYLATMALLGQRPCLMIAESGAPARATPPGRGGWKQPCLQPWL